MPSLMQALRIVDCLLPLEDDGWMIFLGGSTLKFGTGGDVDILLVKEPTKEADRSALPKTLKRLGFYDIKEHVGPDGEPDGQGFTALWRLLKVDIGVQT